jgi:hypothetical protein
MAYTMDAMDRWPESKDPRQVGYSMVLGKAGEISMYEDISKDPVRGPKFGKAMELFSSGQGYEVSSLVEGYPWMNLGSGTVVDVGLLCMLRSFVTANDDLGRRCQRIRQHGNIESFSIVAFNCPGH